MKWVCVATAFLLSSCTAAPQASAITKIVLSRTQCELTCSFAQYTLYPDGRLSYTNGLRYSIQTRVPLQVYRTLARTLVRTHGFVGRRDYLEERLQEASTYIWTEYRQDGFTRASQVRFPTEGLTPSADADVRALNSWSRFAASEASSAVLRERRKTTDRLLRFDLLDRVIFRPIGCFGTCPAYTATFRRDGSAVLQHVMFLGAMSPREGGNVSGRIPFSRVISLLHRSNFAYLDPEYPFRVHDVYGVSFEFDYRDGFSYRVEAPDRTQWSPEVADLAGAFRQLIADTTWRASP